jgi:polysaccharide biosynthesis/export protein
MKDLDCDAQGGRPAPETRVLPSMKAPSSRALVALCWAALLCGCSDLPSSGPTAEEIDDSFRNHNELGFKIVEVTPSVLTALARNSGTETEARLARGKPVRTGRIGTGDMLSISIFEAGSRLFASHGTSDAGAMGLDLGASRETLPKLLVDDRGFITLPYAGRVKAAGLTPVELQNTIQDALKKQSLDPQALVEVTDNVANTAIISGDVKNPGRLPLTLDHEKLLDIIALAGGPTHPSQDTVVTLIRGGQSFRERLVRIDALGPVNTVIEPGDRIQLSFQPRSFTVFGAGGKVSEVPFEAARLSLAEGLARSGGPSDVQADPTGIYVFRFEKPEISRDLGLSPGRSGEPVIYRVNLLEPSSYFAMQQFEMRDKDLIYIANARTDKLQKFMGLISSLFTPAIVSRSLAP